jgi:hypothetical protein
VNDPIPRWKANTVDSRTHLVSHLSLWLWSRVAAGFIAVQIMKMEFTSIFYARYKASINLQFQVRDNEPMSSASASHFMMENVEFIYLFIVAPRESTVVLATVCVQKSFFLKQ